ncbi:Barwin-like endoglucanase [Artemisia annua]|uniref:Barwin-like endoglucanase n=1 Tax=Artemisia annua TaxID=35608 RepID=A0A2U1QEB0_ARTAN|nr:Barwin-like endoglucanase [Artemisia annua]PWA96312.1 Barwin-like endoglucanase [Artemisia annua]
MGLLTRAIILIGMVACLTSVANAIAGQATYYTVYKPSSCYGYEDKGNMIAAVNSGLFANKAACGRRYRVTCTGPSSCKGGSVDVTVVDLCPGCAANGFDLSQEAFSAIADTSVGRINIDYTQI